ncbi:E3 ubiquitin-protein ligase TRIM39-like [Erpetoichthys calabaricus]|uniref:E3 ubiquitin-protein ligase TRIM39-like n=1 Tax=Erpetoichthys calabaricus TaxID=27687 RepID=UPI002234678F|nr:E3 ubiquitin-protein ligase TRIM39-like [Erpetoichthys calabaricus]
MRPQVFNWKSAFTQGPTLEQDGAHIKNLQKEQKENEKLRVDNQKLNEENDELSSEFDKIGIVPDAEWKRIQDQGADMVLSSDTAHSDISVDTNAGQVKFIGDLKGPDRWCCVTGNEAQQDHYWEVEVGEKGSWAIGLASDSIKNNKLIPECPGEGFWIIRLYRGKKLEAVSSTVEELQQKPKKVGIHWKRKCLRFYDVEKKQLIHKFDIEYTECLYPVFSPGSRDKGPLIIKIKQN